MMTANRWHLIGSLILSFSIILCPAAPLHNEDEDDTDASPDWPLQVKDEETKRAKLTGISPFDLMGKRESNEMEKRQRLTGISPFDLMGKRTFSEFKRPKLTGISPFDLVGKRSNEDALKKAKLTGISPFDLMGKREDDGFSKRAKLTGISPFDLMGKRADEWLDAYKRARFTGIGPFDVIVPPWTPLLPPLNLPSILDLKVGRVAVDNEHYVQ